MTGRSSNKGRSKKRKGTVKQCPYCKKPRKWYIQKWSYAQHMRTRHDEEVKDEKVGERDIIDA